jgi:hypothetical protein
MLQQVEALEKEARESEVLACEALEVEDLGHL